MLWEVTMRTYVPGEDEMDARVNARRAMIHEVVGVCRADLGGPLIPPTPSPDGKDAFDGQWNAATIGEFVAILVDDGDPAVLWRVAGEQSVDEHSFIRKYDIVCLPDGVVDRQIKQHHVVRVHKVLARFLQEDILT